MLISAINTLLKLFEAAKSCLHSFKCIKNFVHIGNVLYVIYHNRKNVASNNMHTHDDAQYHIEYNKHTF